jgi:DNA-binding MarR family transcriptional regulator
MRQHNSNTVKLNEQERPRFFGTSEDGDAVLRCADCGLTMSADEAENHNCPANGPIAIADGGINFHRDLTGFQQDILFVLRRIERGMSSESTSYGLAIKRELEQLRETEVNHGRLYPNLDDLVEAGLVEKEMVDRRTNRYSVTDAGQKTLDEYVSWARDSVADTVAVTDGGEEA